MDQADLVPNDMLPECIVYGNIQRALNYILPRHLQVLN